MSGVRSVNASRWTNSRELMSSMSTRSGTFRPRMAVASLVTYCASGTGTRSTVSRSWEALNVSTSVVSPFWVAARHHTSTRPVADVPKPAAPVSGSGSTELQAGSAAARAPSPARVRKPRREVVIVLSWRGGSDRGNPDPHGSGAAVGPRVIRDESQVQLAGRLGAAPGGDDRDAAQQVGAMLGGRGSGRVDMQVVDGGGMVGLLGGVDQRPALDGHAPAHGVDAGVGRGGADVHRQVQLDDVARVPVPFEVYVSGIDVLRVATRGDGGARRPRGHPQGE